MPPLLCFAFLFVGATLLAWVPGYIARRKRHPYASAVNLLAVGWLLLAFPMMWVRPDLSVHAAVAWVVVAGMSFVNL